MLKRFFLFIIFLQLSSISVFAAKYRFLDDFASRYKLDVSNNIDMGFDTIASHGKKIKLFFLMPYIVSESNVYYLKALPVIGGTAKGTTEISSEAQDIVLRLMPWLGSYHSDHRQQSMSLSADIESGAAGETNGNERSNEFLPIDAIIIDPGHGGKDPGGLSDNGIKEKDVVLSVAKCLNDMLEKNDGYGVYMTRRHDGYVSLKERTDIAEGLVSGGKNPLFISIHANISLFRGTSGIEIYALSDQASDKEALSVETIENAGFTKKDIEQTGSLFSIIGDMLKDGIRHESEKLAGYVGKELGESTGAEIRGVKKANFFVLRYNSMPSILVESGFLSNGPEAGRLNSKDYQIRLARGIYRGIMDFIDEYNKSRGFTR